MQRLNPFLRNAIQLAPASARTVTKWAVNTVKKSAPYATTFTAATIASCRFSIFSQVTLSSKPHVTLSSEFRNEVIHLMTSSNPKDLETAVSRWDSVKNLEDSQDLNNKGVAQLMLALNKKSSDLLIAALTNFNKALKLDPTNEAALYNHALAWNLPASLDLSWTSSPQESLKPNPGESICAYHAVDNNLCIMSPKNFETITDLQKLKEPGFMENYVVHSSESSKQTSHCRR